MSGTVSIISAAMALSAERLQAASENFANISTPGYKARVALPASVGFSAALDRVDMEQQPSMLDRSHGAPVHTGRTLDLYIDGESYFQVHTDQGVAYTRRGDFRLDATGTLVSASGHPVVGNGGEIRLPSEDVTVLDDGRIQFEGETISVLSMADLGDQAQLVMSPEGFIRSLSPARPADSGFRVLQGQLEASNVRAALEMANLMETARHFSLSAQALRAHDEMLSIGIDGLGQF